MAYVVNFDKAFPQIKDQYIDKELDLMMQKQFVQWEKRN